VNSLEPVENTIRSLIQKAIEDYRLISHGDHVLAAISGGKDSLTMLHFLREIQKSGQVDFKLTAIHIKTDFHCGACVHQSALTDVFDRYDVAHVVRHIQVLDENKKTTCFWCSWCRRKCLFEAAQELGCNTIALGHHKDDIVETTLLNLFYKGEISTMRPRQDLFDGKLAMIRPLGYVAEDMVRTFAKDAGFPQQLCRCPFGAQSERKAMKNLIAQLSATQPDIRENIFKGLQGVKPAVVSKESL